MPLTPSQLHATAAAKAWAVMAELAATATTPDARTGFGCRTEFGRVRVVIEPPGDRDAAAPTPPRVGQWLSPTCNLILTKLGGDTLTRVDLARRCGMACDPRFKTLVTDLIDRGILEESDDAAGVRAVRPGKGGDRAV
jgi:hypothetical protein